MTGWTTCRVVRDRDGDLWGRSDGNWWSKLGYYWPMGDPEALQSTPSLAEYDPTPVLDADGLPVVTTVGDLTARHLFGAATITYRTEGEISTGVIERTIPIPDGRLRLPMHAPGNRAAQWDDMLSLDTPCEVLP